MKSVNNLAVEEMANDGSATVLITPSEVVVHSVSPMADTTMHYTNMKDKIRVVFAVTGKTLSTEKVDSSEVAAIISQLNPNWLKLLPGKQVKVGETWQDDVAENRKASSGNPFEMEVKSKIENTLTGKEIWNNKECLKISFNGTMTVNGKGTQMGMEMFIEGTGKTEGFFYFDPTTSLVVYNENVTEADMNVAVSGPQNMTIPMTLVTKTITTFEEKK